METYHSDICEREHKTLNAIKRDAINRLINNARAMHQINLNRIDANITLFQMLTCEIQEAANDLICLSNSITTEN